MPWGMLRKSLLSENFFFLPVLGLIAAHLSFSSCPSAFGIFDPQPGSNPCLKADSQPLTTREVPGQASLCGVSCKAQHEERVSELDLRG